MGQNGPDYAKNTIPNVDLKALMESLAKNGGILKGPPMKVVLDVPSLTPKESSLILLPEFSSMLEAIGFIMPAPCVKTGRAVQKSTHLAEFFAYETIGVMPQMVADLAAGSPWSNQAFYSTPKSLPNQFEQMWLNDWGPPSNKVFDPPIKTNPPHKEDPHPEVGFYSYDKTGEVEDMKPLNDKLLDTDDIDKYMGAQGESYKNPSNSTGYTSIDVLKDLWGMPYNNLILAYVHALRPSKVRVSYGEQTLDSCCWRVSIVLDDKEGETFVHSIRQEVAIAYSSGADVGTVKNCVYNDEPPPDTKVAGGCIGHTAGLAKADFS